MYTYIISAFLKLERINCFIWQKAMDTLKSITFLCDRKSVIIN